MHKVRFTRKHKAISKAMEYEKIPIRKTNRQTPRHFPMGDFGIRFAGYCVAIVHAIHLFLRRTK